MIQNDNIVNKDYVLEGGGGGGGGIKTETLTTMLWSTRISQFILNAHVNFSGQDKKYIYILALIYWMR